MTICTTPITERPQLPYPAALLTVFWPAPLGNHHWHPHHRPLRVCVRQAAAPSDQRIAVTCAALRYDSGVTSSIAQSRRGEADRACDLVPTPADVVLSAAPGDERAGRAALKPITRVAIPFNPLVDFAIQKGDRICKAGYALRQNAPGPLLIALGRSLAGPAKRSANSRWSAARTLTAKAPKCSNAGQLHDAQFTQTRSVSGSADSAETKSPPNLCALRALRALERRRRSQDGASRPGKSFRPPPQGRVRQGEIAGVRTSSRASRTPG